MNLKALYHKAELDLSNSTILLGDNYVNAKVIFYNNKTKVTVTNNSFLIGRTRKIKTFSLDYLLFNKPVLKKYDGFVIIIGKYEIKIEVEDIGFYYFIKYLREDLLIEKKIKKPISIRQYHELKHDADEINKKLDQLKKIVYAFRDVTNEFEGIARI